MQVNESPRSRRCWRELCPGPRGAGLPHSRSGREWKGRRKVLCAWAESRVGSWGREGQNIWGGKSHWSCPERQLGGYMKTSPLFLAGSVSLGTWHSHPWARVPSVLRQCGASGEDGTRHPTLPSHTSQVCPCPGGLLVWTNPFNNLSTGRRGRRGHISDCCSLWDWDLVALR